MKRFTSYLLVFAMVLSCFATVFVTTAVAESNVISVGKSYSTTATLHGSMPDGGSDLTDGSKSNANAGTNAGGPYVGYQSSPVEIILDLGSAQNSNVYTLYAAANFWGISAPTSLAISYSDSKDGTYTPASGAVTITKVGDGDTIDGSLVSLHTVTFTSNSHINARYIKYTITPKGTFTWLDEIEAAYDSSLPNVSIPDYALRVHHVDKVVATGEVSVFSSHAALVTANPNGWGVYYQIRATGVANEYKVVAANSNPGTKYAEGGWTFTDATGDLYMQINGGTANASIYSLAEGDILTFINLTLTEGDYTNTYVYAGSASSKLNGAGQYTLSVEPRTSYPDDNRTKLTDGVKSSLVVGDSSKYVAFDIPETLEIVLDLGAAKKTDTYTIYTGKNFYGVNLPTDLKISYSETADGSFTEATGNLVNTFVGEGTPYNNGTQDITPQLYKVSYVCNEAITARYIKFTVTPASNKVLWVDEIEATLSAKNGPVISSYTTSVAPRATYPDEGNKKLIDGVKGSLDITNTERLNYVGYDVSSTMDVILDLGAVKDTDTYTIYTAENFWGVWTPNNINVSICNTADGVFTPVSSTMVKTKIADGVVYNNGTQDITPHIFKITVTTDSIVSARFIKLTFVPRGTTLWLSEIEASLAENGSTGSSYTTNSTAYHADVRADDGIKLTDGIRSSVDFGGSNYAAWTSVETLEIILNLGKVKSTDTYSIYGPENFWGVWTPNSFSVAYSDSADGEFTAIDGTFSKVFVGDGNYYVNNTGIGYTSQLYELRITAAEAIDAQYIKFTIPANGVNIWIDEISASLGTVVYPEPIPTKVDPNTPTTQCNVHHVDKTANTDQISVYTSLDKLLACETGWGMYYQLRQTPNTNEYSIVGACSNPHNNYTNDEYAADNTVFSEALNFTTISKWALPSGYSLDIYMVVKGAAANPSMYSLPIGRTITFRNLTLTEGDYTTTTVMASAASGTVSGMIENTVVENNLAHALANVQKIDGTNVSNLLSAEDAPNDAFFSGSSLDYNAILNACVANKVLPTIQIDTSAQATSLINAMKATGCYDVNVISASASVLAQIRAAHAIPRTGLIYTLTNSSMTSAEIHALRETVRTAPATFIVLNTTNLSKPIVSELQEVGVAVWVKIDTASSAEGFAVEAVSALTTGVNGIITDSSSAITTLINTHFVKDTFTRTPAVVGHRGYPLKGTENTIASFIAAYEYGADIFELDVYTTSDSALVLFHDSSFGSEWGLANTTFTGTSTEGAIQNMTKAQVDAIKYKTGESITYLDEILAYFQDKDIRIFIEFKGNTYERSAKAVANAVKAYGMEDQVCIISAALGFIGQANTYLSGTTGSYVYASTSLTGYAPQNTPAWTNSETNEENLAILSYALMLVQPYNANLSPSAASVSMGYRTSHFMGESTTNRGLVLNPWTYGSAWSNNVAFFSKIDSVTTDVLDWFTDMAKFVSADDVLMFAGQTYTGDGFEYTTYGDKVHAVPEDKIVYSVIEGDSVQVVDGELKAVKDGESKVIMGYRARTSSDAEYVLYSDVVTVNVDSDNVDILKPLIALAETMTVKDFNETDLIALRALYATAVNLVSTNSTDSDAITQTATALSALLDRRYENCIDKVPVASYTAPAANYYKWDSAAQAPSSELHPNHIDDGLRLVDGVKSSTDISSTAYSVWQKSDSLTSVDITVNLGSVQNSNVFTGYFAEYTPNAVLAPKAMNISYQNPTDGTWKSIVTTCEVVAVGPTENGGTLYKIVAKSDEMINAQYVRFNIPFNGLFIWVDEVEVTCVSGGQVEGDYIYVTDFNSTMGAGDSIIYTSGTVSSQNIAWTTNILIEWSDFHNEYVVKSVTEGTGADTTPAVTLEEGQILLAVHDWESNVTDGTAVIGSAINKQRASAVTEGQILKGFGVDVENASLSLAPYVRFIDPDHICEDNGDGWSSDATHHWHTCECGNILDKDVHDQGAWFVTKPNDVDVVGKKELKCTVCGEPLAEEEIPATHAPATEEWFNNETHHWNECGCGLHLNENKHDQGQWVNVTPAGVDQAGYDELRCLTCGYVLDTRNLDATHEPATDDWKSDEDSHWKECGCGMHLDEETHDDGIWVTVTPVGVDQDGYNELRCTVCGYVLDTETVPATHEPANNGKWFSDESDHWQTCGCGKVLNLDAHKEGTWEIVKNAEIGVEGKKELRCTVCNYLIDEEIIPALEEEHQCSPETDWKSDKDNHWKECGCGKHLDEDTHDEGIWVTVKPNDVDVIGKKERQCTICGYVLETEDIPAKHEPANNGKWYTDSTDHWQICDCGKHLNEGAHDDGVWVTVTPVGVDQAGYDELRCTVCGYVLDTRNLDATHEPATDDWKSDKDNHWKECGCGKHLDEEAHDDGIWVTVTPVDVDQDGYNELRCTVCGYVLDSETVPALHQPVGGANAKWESDKDKHWKECGCGEHLEEAAHTGKWITVKDAEIGVDGKKEFRCSVCDYLITEETIPALKEDTVKVLRGDINQNGKIDARDYLLLKRAFFKTYELTCDDAVADVNNNGKLDARDYLLLKRMFFGTYQIPAELEYVEVKK